MVPKRVRWLGCTLNFAHPFAVPFLILLIGIPWPLLDEDLSIKGMLEGNPSFEHGRPRAQATV